MKRTMIFTNIIKTNSFSGKWNISTVHDIKWNITVFLHYSFYLSLPEKVGRSFSVKVKDGNHELNDEEDIQPHNVGDFADPFNAMSLKSVTDEDEPQPQVKPKKKSLPFSFTPMEFESGKWFYDTPGVLHDRQVC